jgi:hypothetical protein
LLWGDLWKLYPTLSMYNWDTAECVHGEYQDVWRKFTKIDVWRCSFASLVTERSSRQVPWIHVDIVGHGFTILLKMNFNAMNTSIFIDSHEM